MTDADYRKILEALQTATRTLTANQGDLCASDIRIRSLVNMATVEAERSLGVVVLPAKELANGSQGAMGQ